MPGFAVLRLSSVRADGTDRPANSRGVTRQADDPLAQAVQRDRHPGQAAIISSASGGIGLAFVVDQLHAARLRCQRQLGAAQRVS